MMACLMLGNNIRLNPLVNDAAIDVDNDGLTNLQNLPTALTRQRLPVLKTITTTMVLLAGYGKVSAMAWKPKARTGN